jgi:hypothetical protein
LEFVEIVLQDWVGKGKVMMPGDLRLFVGLLALPIFAVIGASFVALLSLLLICYVLENWDRHQRDALVAKVVRTMLHLDNPPAGG